MVARLNPLAEPLRLTAQNHPENAAAPTQTPSTGLWPSIFLGMLCGLVGMVFGGASLSTAFAADKPDELLSVGLLIMTAVGLLTGWMGAFAWMLRHDGHDPGE